MRLQFLNFFLILMVFILNIGCAFGIRSYVYEVDVANNKVGFPQDSTCMYSEIEKQVKCTVKQKNGRQEKYLIDIDTFVGSNVGTPPWLQYNNFLGIVTTEENKKHNQRTILLMLSGQPDYE